LTARAQLVADGASKLINGTTTNVTGDLVIGTNGAFTTLIITNAGMVTNTGNGTIGLNTSAKSNQVIVVDDLSLWGMGGNLVIGNAGSYNSLLVTNDGMVLNNFGNIGLNAGGANNSAIVTGG